MEVRIIGSRDKALLITKTAQDKKADDIVMMDMRRISSVTDFFIICSGASARSVRAIADSIMKTLDEAGYRVGHVEGYKHGLWVLLDYGGALVHIFYSPLRSFYQLEHLWGDAPLKHMGPE